MAKNEHWAAESYASVLHALVVGLHQAPERLFTGGAGFERAVALMARLGDPQDTVPMVHIAGTAGKGSVAYAVAAGLRRGGLRTGLHVSPHVMDIRERWQVDAEFPSESEVVETFGVLAPVLREMESSGEGLPTYFEATVAMALLHFRNRSCDIGVVETGLGGQFDATNTCTSSGKIAVVTRIGFDHEAVLGSTLGEIARQKAGILPVEGMAFAALPESQDVRDVFERVADERSCELVFVDRGARSRGVAAHVAENESLAEAVVDEVLRRRTIETDRAAVSRAIAEVQIPGRFQVLEDGLGRIAILDGAHNPMKLEGLLHRLELLELDVEIGWVFGCRADKKVDLMLGSLLSRGETVRFVQFEIAAGDVLSGMSMGVGELEELAGRLPPGGDAEGSVSLSTALGSVLTRRGAVVVAGSFMLVQPAYRLLREWGFEEAVLPSTDGGRV